MKLLFGIFLSQVPLLTTLLVGYLVQPPMWAFVVALAASIALMVWGACIILDNV